MWSSILFFIINIVSGILGFIVNGNLDNPKKNEKRALPQIELKEYTNKYICFNINICYDAFKLCTI